MLKLIKHYWTLAFMDIWQPKKRYKDLQVAFKGQENTGVSVLYKSPKEKAIRLVPKHDK